MNRRGNIIMTGKIILGLAVSFLAAGSAFAQEGAALSNFVKGNSAYQEGQYDEAIQHYEAILQSGSGSGAVLYNLGNSYFKKQKLGKALLNYERARQLIPRDGDLESNYHYALSLVKKFSDAPQKNWLERVWGDWLDYFSADEWAWGTYAWLLIAAGVHLLSLWLKWPANVRRTAVSLLIFVWLAHGFAFLQKLDAAQRSAVAVAETKALYEPREESTVHFDVVEGGEVELLKTEGDWAKVKRPDGKMGWVRREFVEKI